MSLEKASITWSAKQLSGMVKNGKINFDHIVQRSYVWERKRKSALIESMILGYPVPPIYAKRIEGETEKRGNNIYYIMDGKQRLSTVKEFLSDEFTLTELAEITYQSEDGQCEYQEDISGLKFSELPEILKDRLNDTVFSVIYFDNLTKEEEKELFKRLNAGKPLSSKSKLLASCNDIEGLLDIGSHPLFTEMLTDKARANKNQATIVMKCWCMLNKEIEDICFESKTFNPIVEQTYISETEKMELVKVFDLIRATHNELKQRKESKVAKKLYTETHMVSLVPFFKATLQQNLDEIMMADWLIDFYKLDNSASTSKAYNDHCSDGSAKTINIVGRDNALHESYNMFFECTDAEDNTENDKEDNAEDSTDNTVDSTEETEEETEED